MDESYGKIKNDRLSYGVQYLQASSFHGLKYIASKNSYWIDRCLWLLNFLAATIGALVVMWFTWGSFRNLPTQTVIDTTTYPVWNIPFPAVTFCNIYKLQHRLLSKFMDEYTKGLDAEEVQDFFTLASDLGVQCLDYFRYNNPVSNKTKKNKKWTQFSIRDFMLKVAEPVKEVFHSCAFRSVSVPCEDLFEIVRTEDGLCYTFNSALQSEGRFVERLGRIPLRNSAAGRVSGLLVYLKERTDGIPRHMTIYLHSPYSVPNIAKYLGVNPGNWILLVATPEQTFSEDDVRSVDFERRQCVFPEEMASRVSGKTYDQERCLMECRGRHIEKSCNCSYYMYPRFDDVVDCSPIHMECLISVVGDLLVQKPPPGTAGFDDDAGGIECSCPQSCTETDYFMEHRFEHLGTKQFTLVDVHFQKASLLKYRREVAYGWIDFLGSFGGILGLFLGSSLMSLVELVYFFSLRLLVARCNR